MSQMNSAFFCAVFQEAQFQAKKIKILSYMWITYIQWHLFLKEVNVSKSIHIMVYRIGRKVYPFSGSIAISMPPSLTKNSESNHAATSILFKSNAISPIPWQKKWDFCYHPPYQYQIRNLFNYSGGVNWITQHFPWYHKIYLMHIIPLENTMMKTPNA